MNVKGVPVHFRDEGSGKTVLFLHGWGVDHSSFGEAFERTRGHYRVCALDLPGFGRSEEPPAAWGVGDYADFVLAFLAEREIREAVLVGHSFGGRIAIKLAALQGALQVPKLVLVDSAGVPPVRTLSQRLRTFFYKTARRLLSIPPLRERTSGFIERWRIRRASTDYRNASPRMRECLVRVVNEDLTPLMPLISCPTLLIWGENDTATPVSDARVMERLIPDAGLVVFKNAGHYSFLDQSYAFGRVLDSFLGIVRAEEEGRP
ncbi:MAG: alpha/beta hydrolase [Fretibacterium sp.]|nr:alpha/beta hydrolase [Fretibacterium sp.]